MTRWIVVPLAMIGLAGAGRVDAQESVPGPGVEMNLNRYVGVEVTGALGITQDLQFFSATVDLKTSNLLNDSSRVGVLMPSHGSVTPYGTGSVGGPTLFDNATLGIPNPETLLTGNTGGSVKWFHGIGPWGDYRFIAVQSEDDAPAFWDEEGRYGHRMNGAVVINAVR
jgi:hypothetical protein